MICSGRVAFLASPSLLFQLCGEAADPKIAAAFGFHGVAARPFEDDRGAGVVGDFHEPRSEGVFAAQGYVRVLDRAALGIRPFAIDHAGDPADDLRRRFCGVGDCSRRRRIDGDSIIGRYHVDPGH